MNTIVTARIPNDIVIQLENIAKDCNRKRGAIVRDIVEKYVKAWSEEKAIRKAELASWENYQETGLHVTEAEMDAWLSSWGTENELPPPVCHV